MDSVLDIKTIPILESTLIDSYVRKNIRLLCVFGCNGEEVIYITNEDKAYGYGRNRFGGLGLGVEEDTHYNIREPKFNEYLSDKQVVDISCGYEHWIALTADGSCYSWGHNQFGQLGTDLIGGSNSPLLIPIFSNSKVVSLSCGATHSLALTSDGQVYSWGNNKSGQLGNGSKGFVSRPHKLLIEDKVVSISCGKNHSIALSNIGQVYVWGLNNYGQLGTDLKSGFIQYYPKLIFGSKLIHFSKVICGPNYSLLLSSDGDVYAFGENSCGQIGNGSTDNQVTPFKVNDDFECKEIIAHKENDVSIGVTVDNRFYVWGLAKNRRYLRPKEITDSSSKSLFDFYAKYSKTKLTFKTLVVNEVIERQTIENNLIDFNSKAISHITSQRSDYKSKTRPQSQSNLKRLDDVLDVKSFPILYTTLSDQRVRNSIRLLRVYGVKGCKVMFITNSDKVYAFGLNRDGSLGLGGNEIKIRKPQLNRWLSGKQLVEIAPGFEHCLGLTASGLIYGWGQNRYGQLGCGNTEDQYTPQLVTDLSDLKVVDIQCGAYFSLALTIDGELFSWGHNTFAQLGDRTYNSREIPTQVFISERVKSISCGTNHTMALSESGKVYIWGNNTIGQLGRNPELDVQKSREKPMSNRPRVVEGMGTVAKAVCGENHSLVLTTDGYLYAFGDNSCGQIGNNTLKPQFTPLKLNKDNTRVKIKDIVSNFDVDISIAVTEDKKCFVWGYVEFKNVLKPKPISESSDRLLDIYGRYAANKTTFKTVIVNSLEDIESYGNQLEEPEDLFPRDEEYYHLYPQNLYNFTTNELKIRKEMIDMREVKAFDEEIDVNLFPILNPILRDMNITKNISLLYVFGKSATNVLYATNEHKVYAFGDNTDGCLGLGTYDLHIKNPTLNQTLSYIQLIDIRNGFRHCLALTASGEVYSWGHNRYGQLGIGVDQPSNSPKLIKALKDKNVIQICCGANHSMALTSGGQVYTWGLNILGQLGTSNYQNYFSPMFVEVKHPIVSISCGLNHTSAVDNVGMSYIWGHNKFGQLGRERDRDYRPERKEWVANRPSSNLYFKNTSFIKSICGPNYTLFLSNDGFIYAFGDNTNGQVGTGFVGQQFRPLRINEEIRFKDIITHYANDLSIGVSTDDKYYIWGLADNQRVLSPKLISGSGDESLFNTYAKYAAKKITFKTIIFNEKKVMNQSIIKSNEEITKELTLSDSNEEYNLYSDQSTSFDNMSTHSSIQCSFPSNVLQNKMSEVFNNPNNFDLKITAEDKVIYCHKQVIQLRNASFWTVLSQQLTEDKTEIKINTKTYETFYAFIQCFYGLDPELTPDSVSDLYQMAHHFNEKELLEDCLHYIRNSEQNIVNLLNVCPLYEIAIKEGFVDFEKTCLEFAANNWKLIVTTNGFQSMDESISKRFMFSALSFK